MATPGEAVSDFLSGGGEMGALIRGHDWASTPLGPIESWPQSLKTAVAMVLLSPVPIVMLWGVDGVMIYNDAYSGFAGGRHPQLLGSKVREGWPEVADFNDNVMKVGLAGGTLSYKDQELTLHRHGRPEQVWMNLDYSPVLDESGRPAGVIAIVVETTDRVLSERRIRASEARLRSMADNLPVMVWVTDKDGQCVYLNRHWYAFTGQSEAEALGTGWLDAIHPDDRGRSGEIFFGAAASQEPFRMEYRLRRADGSYRWAIDTGSPRLGANGEVAGFVGSVIDIEERRAAEDALRESEARFRAMADSAPAPVWVTGPDGIEFVNRAFCEFAGLPAERLLGGAWTTIIHPDDLPAAATTRAEAWKTGTPYGFEARFRDGDGAWRWMMVNSRPRHDSDGALLGYTGMAVDLTEMHEVAIDNARLVEAAQREIAERRRAQEALAELNASLEQRIMAAIGEREEMEEALRQSQKMEAVGQLTGGIAHDFNNLLTVITGNLELAQRQIAGAGNARLERNIASALAGAERAALLTQRLLAFSRRQPLAPKPTDANKLVRGMSELLRRALGETIAIETVLGPGLWRIEIDSNQLENAILNLALNARDAMGQGGKLTIETMNTHLDRGYAAENSEVAAGQYVAICVTDTGSGMDSETLARAYEPFFTTKEVGKGTGLGLSMVYGFVRQSGGHLKIHSEPGVGTSVKIYLPRLAGDGRVQEAGRASPAPAGSGDETILVCEDDPEVRAYTTEVLRELGYCVVAAADGPAALRQLEASDGKIDLLFTDIVLPSGMNGEMLARQARALRPDLKVLFTTGYARDAIVHQGRLDPGVELITKPFAYAELAARVRDMLDAGA